MTQPINPAPVPDPDLDAKRRAWTEAPDVRCSVPPVCTVYWDVDSWVRWVDWTTENNAAVLARFK